MKITFSAREMEAIRLVGVKFKTYQEAAKSFFSGGATPPERVAAIRTNLKKSTERTVDENGAVTFAISERLTMSLLSHIASWSMEAIQVGWNIVILIKPMLESLEIKTKTLEKEIDLAMFLDSFDAEIQHASEVGGEQHRVQNLKVVASKLYHITATVDTTHECYYQSEQAKRDIRMLLSQAGVQDEEVNNIIGRAIVGKYSILYNVSK